MGMNLKNNSSPKIKSNLGEVLLQLCESRLDNLVYRLGIAPTRSAARQLVGHRHITLNGEIMNIPSRHVKVGDVIGVREKSKSLEVIERSLSVANATTLVICHGDFRLVITFLLARIPRSCEPPKIIPVV